MVLGVATWQPAIGAVAGVSLRPRDYLSLGVEGRAAWVTSGVADRPINAMTAGGIASVCGHYRWFYGCALGHLGVINIRFDRVSYKEDSFTFVTPGGGGRVGVTMPLSRGFVLGGSFDALFLCGRTKIVDGQTVIVDHPPVMLGASVAGGWEF